MPAPTSFVKGTFKNSAGAPLAAASVLFKPTQTPFTLSGDVVTSNLLVATLDSNGQFGQTSNFPLVTGYYLVVVSDVDSFTILVPADGALYDVEAIAIHVAGSVTSNITKSAADTAVLSQSIVGSTTIKVARKGDLNSPRQKFIFMAGTESANVKISAPVFQTEAADFVIGVQMNPTGLLADLEATVASTFHAYIKGYSGPSGSGPSTQSFYYGLGQSDLAGGASGSTKTFFTLSANYYSFVRGDITFFVLSSAQAEPTNTFASAQGVWFQAAVAAATTTFKIVVVANAPVASVNSYAAAWMNWPFKDLGIDLVLAGGPHIDEHLVYGSVPFLISGTVRSTRDTVFGPLSGSVTTNGATPAFWVLTSNSFSLEARLVQAGVPAAGGGYPVQYTPNRTAVKAAPYYIVATGGPDTLTSGTNGSINNNTFFPGITDFVVGSRILVPSLYNGTTAGTNITHAYSGVFTVSNLGSAGTPFILQRATDMDSLVEFNGSILDVTAGGHYSSGSRWILVNQELTLGSTAQIWERVRLSGTAISPTSSAVRIAFANELLPLGSPSGEAAFYVASTGVITNNGAGAVSINSTNYGAYQGVTNLVAGDRVLIVGPCPWNVGLTHAFPGIYTITEVGGVYGDFILTRATDADTDAKLTNSIVYVTSGYHAGRYMTQFLTPSLSGSAPLRWDILAQGSSTFDYSNASYSPGISSYYSSFLSKDRQLITLSAILKRNAGLLSSVNGIIADFGSGANQVASGNTAFLANAKGTRRYQTLPTDEEIRLDGWAKDCLILVGFQPIKLYVWDPNLGGLVLVSTLGSTVSALTKLAAPTTVPMLGINSTVYQLAHSDPTVAIYLSINGSAFTKLSAWNPLPLAFNPELANWMAYYASKTGYRDSDIAIQQVVNY